MIQFDNDSVTLFYIDANGNKVSHNYRESGYGEMLTIRGAQLQADRDNNRAVQNYTELLARATTEANAPKKPLCEVVSDTGVVSYGPFVPALPDFVVVPQVAPRPGGSMFPPVDWNKPVQRDEEMYNMVKAMFRRMFPEA